jgi:hypothetical protein
MMTLDAGAQVCFHKLVRYPDAMTTRIKLYITSYTMSAMMLLTVFSKPLHIPEAIQWVLIIGVFVPIGLMFYFIKKQKQEKLGQPSPAEATVADGRKSVKNRLILMMVTCSLIGLCAPFWMPVTGSGLGVRGDFICGIITVAIVCTILGLRLRKI